MSWVADYAIAVLQRYPFWARLLAGLVRNTIPIVKLGGSFFVLQAEDIREVLDEEEFEIGQPNGRKMLQGKFVLGMDSIWPQHGDDLHALETILDSLLPTYVACVDQACNAAFDKIAGASRIDLVSQIAEPVIIDLAQKFYGIELPEHSDVIAADTDNQRLANFLRVLNWVIAFRSPAPFGRQRIAQIASKEFKAHLDNLIRGRAHAIAAGRSEPAPTVLDHLIVSALQTRAIDDKSIDWIRANLAGLLIAGSAPLIKAFCHTINQLLRGEMGGSETEPLIDAIDAANDPPPRRRLEGIILEALRFNPAFPLVRRYCPFPTTIAAKKDNETDIPGGATVVPVLISGMFDESTMQVPESYRGQRAPNVYLHFGSGAHKCLGENMARATLVAMVSRLLLSKGCGGATIERLKYDGVAVDRFEINLP
jgi:cytochrome P450